MQEDGMDEEPVFCRSKFNSTKNIDLSMDEDDLDHDPEEQGQLRDEQECNPHSLLSSKQALVIPKIPVHATAPGVSKKEDE
mmetsp:Transcript_44656/g.97517  ORF Transcript_44656/g.97517 Transcript_44656/m.97517 type:complete len:81 (-) Transcript_44656:792-1034(-)